MTDAIIVGAGYAGAVCARRLAEECNKRVLVLERRGHIAGNMYDFTDAAGVLTHRYGPHIAAMNDRACFEFLSRFTPWIPYHHRVQADIDGTLVPLPINLTGVDLLFPVERAIALKLALIGQYGQGANVPILMLRESADPAVVELAEYIFEKVFLHYTEKMWGLTPEAIDPAVTARVPVRVSYDDRHFQHTYQVMPRDGYTKLFEAMLGHPNISVQLNTDASAVLAFEADEQRICFDGKEFCGAVVYTGALDELFAFDLGELPYRSLRFEFETRPVEHVQDTAVLNWPDSRPATRRTEMKRLTGQVLPGVTSTITEYPGAYSRQNEEFSEPMYPIPQPANLALHARYRERAGRFPNLFLTGRLADYKYYNMEAAILAAFRLFETKLRGFYA